MAGFIALTCSLSTARTAHEVLNLSVAALHSSSMADAAGSQDSQLYPKTHAKELYCLTDKDLAALTPKEKRNPYVRNGSTMKLYKQSEVGRFAYHSTCPLVCTVQ